MFPLPRVTPTTTAKSRPHRYVDPEATGVCEECPLPKANRIHSEEAIAELERAVDERHDEAARRAGER